MLPRFNANLSDAPLKLALSRGSTACQRQLAMGPTATCRREEPARRDGDAAQLTLIRRPVTTMRQLVLVGVPSGFEQATNWAVTGGKPAAMLEMVV